MEIRAEALGKRFNRDWIFRELNYTFESGRIYAIVGPNGSGKSTLIKVLSGQMPFNVGQISYHSKGLEVNSDAVYKQISMAAPYLELIEEFTLEEMWKFHFGFKGLMPGINLQKAVEITGLQKGLGKQIKNFSSGMKQRLKLGLAFFSETSLLLLDEPTSNLDKEGNAMFSHLVDNFKGERTIIIGSNVPFEIDIANHSLNISQFQHANS
jgi:ABC-type multidrug transport system ATPase subunit